MFLPVNHSYFFSKRKQNKWKSAPFQEVNRIPLIVFGNGMFRKDLVKLKGIQSGVIGKFFRVLKKREAEGQLIALTIDEYNTSKTCSLCFFDDMKIISTKLFKGVGVVCCANCSKV